MLHLKSPWIKTHVLKNAHSFSVLKIWFFSRREIEILSQKSALIPPFKLFYLRVKRYLNANVNKTARKAAFPSYIVLCS